MQRAWGRNASTGNLFAWDFRVWHRDLPEGADRAALRLGLRVAVVFAACVRDPVQDGFGRDVRC